MAPLVLLVVGGCEPAPRREVAPRSVIADIIVSVANETPRAMTIYLKAGATTDSLGVVGARASRSFSLPSGLDESVDSLRFEAREPRATSGLRSEPFQVSAGQQVRWAFNDLGSRIVTTR